jgi:hypothetical protein
MFPGNSKEEVIKKQKTLTVFNEAMESYLNSSFTASIKAIESVTEIHPEDQAALFFLAHAKNHLQKRVPANWSSVMEVTMKETVKS